MASFIDPPAGPLLEDSPTLPVLTTSSDAFPSVIAFDSGLSVVWLQAQPCKKTFLVWDQ